MKVRRNTIISCMIAIAFLISSILPFLAVDTPSDSQPAHIEAYPPWADFLVNMTFTREPRNPLMQATEVWEGVEIGDYSIVEEAANYTMYYSGLIYTAVANGIGRATSPLEYPPVNWTKVDKVFAGNATPGQWDSGSVRLGTVLKDNGTYYMYYGGTPAVGFSGAVQIGLATSTNGFTWIRHGNAAPVLTSSGDEIQVEDPAVVRVDATHWYMYYSYRTAGAILPGIRVATSPDGVAWTKVGDVISKGSAGQWDDTYIEHSNVYYIDGHFVLLFEAYGGSGSEPWQIGLAYSTSPTTAWVKYASNPIFGPSHTPGAFDEYHVDTPFLLNHDEDWYLFFGGADAYSYGPANWMMGIAYSPGASAATPPPGVKLWTAGGASTASTSGSWTPAGVPQNGDTLIFNSTSIQNCNYNLAYVRPASILMNIGYLGTVTLSVDLRTYYFLVANGTLTTTGNPILSVMTFTRTTYGTTPTGTFKLVMLSDGAILNGGPGAGILFRPYSIIFKGDTTVSGDWVRAASYMEIYAGKTVSISLGSHLVLDTWASFAWYNYGIIEGPGQFVLQAYQTVNMPSLGTINAPTEMTLEPVTASDPTVTLINDMTLGSSFSIIGYNTHVNTLTLGGYNLTANGITIEILGQIVATSSDIIDSGNWDSSAGFFVPGDKLYMTAGRIGGTMAEWTANANQSMTFTVSNLTNGQMYAIWIDGERRYTVTVGAAEEINLTYAGPWSTHQFKIAETVLTQQVSGIVNLVFIMFAIGIVVGVVAEGTSSLRKMQMRTTEQMVKSLLNMVIYIVIGIASLGVLYSIVV